jgi:hypothetical protein
MLFNHSQQAQNTPLRVPHLKFQFLHHSLQYDCIYEHSAELLQCIFCTGGVNRYLRFRLLSTEGTRWCSWLRHCATSPKVAGSIPDGGLNSTALVSTQPLTEMSTRCISWG